MKSEKKMKFEDEQEEQQKKKEDEFVQVNLPSSMAIEPEPEDEEALVGLAAIPQLESEPTTSAPVKKEKFPKEGPPAQKPVNVVPPTKKPKKLNAIIHQPK